MEEQFYPELTEEGEILAQKIIDKFKEKAKTILSELTEELLANIYSDVAYYIKSDSWHNFRNQILSGIHNYQNKENFPYEFKDIRQAIFNENREEIIKDLNQDFVEENTKLKKEIEELYLERNNRIY